LRNYGLAWRWSIAPMRLPGRATPIGTPGPHFVNGNRVVPPFPDGMQTAVFGEGFFWGTERGFWELAGVYSTAVVYAGGYTPNPAYNEVCSGRTGHAEAALVVFDPSICPSTMRNFGSRAPATALN
jgi:peptide-methionine (S)-S-oxide reductase